MGTEETIEAVKAILKKETKLNIQQCKKMLNDAKTSESFLEKFDYYIEETPLVSQVYSEKLNHEDRNNLAQITFACGVLMPKERGNYVTNLLVYSYLLNTKFNRQNAILSIRYLLSLNQLEVLKKNREAGTKANKLWAQRGIEESCPTAKEDCDVFKLLLWSLEITDN
jgi:hypothetical protein